MDALKEIDAVLSVFIPITLEKERGTTLDGIKIRLLQRKIDINDIWLEQILNKLVKDKFLDVIKQTEPMKSINVGDITIYYVLNFEGELFLKKGGYTGEAERETREAVFHTSIQKWLAFGTVVAAIATVGILLLEVWKCFHSCPCK